MLAALSVVAFVLLLTGLILIHEVGHFFVARLSGVDVEEFGFGLPPRIRKLFRWKGTDFTLNWIPVGGFVRLKGEGTLSEKARVVSGSFARAHILQRCAILLAGVTMNFLLALIIFTLGFSLGGWIPTYDSLEAMERAASSKEISFTLHVLLDEVLQDGSAARAGVPPRSILLAVDGVSVVHPEDVVPLQAGKKQVRYDVLVGKDFALQQTFSVPVFDGKTGVLLRTIPRSVHAEPRTFVRATVLAFQESWMVTVQTVRGMGMLLRSLFTAGVVPKEVTGIVGIAHLTYASVQEGIGTYFRLVALMSLSLAVLNVLPFPALDGGRLLFVVLEPFFQRRLVRRVELVVNTIGFTFLLFLILIVTFYDVVRLFTR